MISQASHKQKIHDQIGFLFDPEVIEEMIQVGVWKEANKDEVLLDAGDDISFMPVVIEGSLKVSREKDDMGELLLYYIESGDSCAMTIQCCVRKSKSEIKATAMEDSIILMIPVSHLEMWLDKFSSWRKYILSSYHTRMIELMDTIDAIAFMRLDERLDRYLKDQAKLLGSLEIQHTHQQIAEDLHSSRVVISRLLKQMEHKGMIKIKRNSIILSEI